MMKTLLLNLGFQALKMGKRKYTTKIKAMDKLKLIGYYTKNFLLNPYYLNDSILDTALAIGTHLSKKMIFCIYINIFIGMKAK